MHSESSAASAHFCHWYVFLCKICCNSIICMHIDQMLSHRYCSAPTIESDISIIFGEKGARRQPNCRATIVVGENITVQWENNKPLKTPMRDKARV